MTRLLTDLCHELVTLPLIAQIKRALTSSASSPLRVAPLIGAARAPVVAALARATNTPLLFVLANSDQALRATEDLRQWLTAHEVLFYPAGDALPYEHMSPGPDILSQRLRVLAALWARRADPTRPPPVIVAPIRALLQPTLAPTELADASLLVQRGTELPQEGFIQRLVALGYRVVPVVEEPGEVSRRGGIVDLWSPTDALPLRIEWFGDEIDSLRRFTAQTQRSDQRVEQALIGPPHEIPLWNAAQAQAQLQQLDLAALRREARHEWETALLRLEQGEGFEGRAFFAPFFRPQRPAPAHEAVGFSPERDSSLLAHLPPNVLMLWSEAGLIALTATDLHRQATAQRLAQIETGELPTCFPRPYFLWEDVVAQIDARRLQVLDLSNNEVDAQGLSVTDPFGVPTILVPKAATFSISDLFGGQFKRLVADIVEKIHDGERVVVVTTQAARVQELVQEAYGEDRTVPPTFVTIHNTLDQGWFLPDLRLTLYTDSEIFGWRRRRSLSERRQRRERATSDRTAFLRGLKSGDYVVHIEHGIAIFEGMIRRTVGEIEREYLNLQYAGGDRLYVPVDQVDRVARYVGAGDTAPQLTRLHTQEWERAKRKARAAVQDLAGDLLDIYARRQLSTGRAVSPDNDWQRELEQAFPYSETEDQLRALVDVKRDMEEPRPMDRLICGDVGFGKTEVALRAAFKAIQDGLQVALLVPTTVLAQQHYDTFSRRMAAFPVVVEMLSRFRSPKAQETILRDLIRGKVDILIGTHRMLSKDVLFKRLGLVIVDEEQRFGVRHKERLKQLRAEVDVLTLTATPIPRTLHMALAGIRDLSVINTPPEDRVPIKTYVVPYDEHLIRDALLREIDRGGQVYFVHNRVHSIYHVATHLRTLVPEARIAVGHGQLAERELERVMLEFFDGSYGVLVCTTIIESGLDIPNANTIIIDDATHYGLAQLYQLRGRVGRSANRAYAYLLYQRDTALTEEAQQRLAAIQEATELGAGFKVAMRDLEIRGAGNLLGAEQSGHIAAVGFDLYSRLLEQAVRQLKAHFDAAQRDGKPFERQAPTTEATETAAPPRGATKPTVRVDERVLVSPLVTLDLPMTAYLPSSYIPDDSLRLSIYQRMVEAQTVEAVRDLRNEIQDRFGQLPAEAGHLLVWLQIKALALVAGVASVVTMPEEFIIRLNQPITLIQRERLRRRFLHDSLVKIGQQMIRLDRRELKQAWLDKLLSVLEVLQPEKGEAVAP